MSKITKIHARQIFDSRANPTVEVTLSTAKYTVLASVPSGASTGVHEALELRDGQSAYLGKGVTRAVMHVNTLIAPKLIGKSVLAQKQIDEIMCSLDGTPTKSVLGANAILGVSMAVAKAGALHKKLPLYAYLGKLAKNSHFILPIPCMNIINGGKHADSGLAIQECMIVPSGAQNFAEAMQIGTEVYHTLKDLLKKKFGSNATALGDEGGFAPPLTSIQQAIALLEEAIVLSGHDAKVQIAIDAAASEFCKNGKYQFEGKSLSSIELLDIYQSLLQNKRIVSLEDPFEQEDFTSYRELKKRVHKHCQIVGDDLLVTTISRMKLAKKADACSALLLKINQVGTISEAIAAARLAKKFGWNVMVSHRSGETEDTFIADLAVALGCGQIKAGAPARGERVAKYNQLLRIEEQLGEKAQYPNSILRVS